MNSVDYILNACWAYSESLRGYLKLSSSEFTFVLEGLFIAILLLAIIVRIFASRSRAQKSVAERTTPSELRSTPSENIPAQVRADEQQEETGQVESAQVSEFSAKVDTESNIQTETRDSCGDAYGLRENLSAEIPVTELPGSVGANVERGLSKSRSYLLGRLQALFRSGAVAERGALMDEFEEILISADLGVGFSKKALDLISKMDLANVSDATARRMLETAICETLESGAPSDIQPAKVQGNPKVILVVGVNGVGKTTTIAKLAKTFAGQQARVLLGAADTFRAAAVDQLQIWAQRIGVDIELGEMGEKPSTVCFRAVHRAVDGAYDVLIIDTAGRLHTRSNLMNELGAVVQIIARELPGAPHETLLVVDGSTGQNAVQQAREFHSLVALTGVVVTKLDGTAKGGVVVAIKDELGVPIRYIGVGEREEDLRSFSAPEFARGLLEGEVTEPNASVQTMRQSTKVRRRRREDSTADSA